MKVQYPRAFACLSLLARLPLPVIRLFGWILGSAAYVLNPSRRRVTRTNLRLAFPALSEPAIRALCKAHLRHLGMALTDRIWLWFAPLPTVYARLHLTGVEHLPQPSDPLAPARPTILLVPHFAGLETAWPAWVAACEQLGRAAPQLTTIFQPQRTQWEDVLFRYGRGRFGDIHQYTRHDGIRPVMKDLKAGRAYYCLPDNDFGSKDAVFVPFFGLPAATLTVLPRLSNALNARVIPMVTRMTAGGYAIEALAAWDQWQGSSIEAYCEHMNTSIECWARTMPEQYLFSHRRYKTRPPGQASLY